MRLWDPDDPYGLAVFRHVMLGFALGAGAMTVARFIMQDPIVGTTFLVLFLAFLGLALLSEPIARIKGRT